MTQAIFERVAWVAAPLKSFIIILIKTILVFGGSFNPPTLAHQAIITACLALPKFDEVWVMPSGNRADKAISVSDDDRLQMLKIVKSESFANTPRLKVSDFELKLPRPTRLHRTVTELAKTYPHTTFWFAFGGDAYKSMALWYAADDFIKTLKIVVFTENDVPEAKTGNAIHLNIPKPFQQMSSTQVRQAFAAGTPVAANWVAPAVRKYIAAHRLY